MKVTTKQLIYFFQWGKSDVIIELFFRLGKELLLLERQTVSTGLWDVDVIAAHMSFSKNRMSSEFSSVLSSTVSSASLLPGNSESSAEDLKGSMKYKPVRLEMHPHFTLMVVCQISPSYFLYLNWGNAQLFSNCKLGLRIEMTKAERLETRC